MADDLRISADELKRRINDGEEFTVVDARNPRAWAESNDKAFNAIRVAADDSDAVLSGLPRDKPVVIYCT
jgi:rhodanese-related sulfurtransferase